MHTLRQFLLLGIFLRMGFSCLSGQALPLDETNDETIRLSKGFLTHSIKDYSVESMKGLTDKERLSRRLEWLQFTHYMNYSHPNDWHSILFWPLKKKYSKEDIQIWRDFEKRVKAPRAAHSKVVSIKVLRRESVSRLPEEDLAMGEKIDVSIQYKFSASDVTENATLTCSHLWAISNTGKVSWCPRIFVKLALDEVVDRNKLTWTFKGAFPNVKLQTGTEVVTIGDGAD